MLRPLIGYLEKKDPEKFVNIMSKILLVGGLVSMIILVPLTAKYFHVEENAFHYRSSQHTFDKDIAEFYDETKLELKALYKEGIMSGKEYIKEVTKNIGLQTYSHMFPVYDGKGKFREGENIYTYVHAPRSFGRECIMFVYKHNIGRYNISIHSGIPNTDTNQYIHLDEVALALSLMKQLTKQNYLSKDILFVGYDGDIQYGKAIQTFLDDYHSADNHNLKRCGMIRQGLAVDIKQDDYNNIAVVVQGKNGKLPDMDLPSCIHSFLDRFFTSWEWDDIGFFRNDPKFKIIQDYYSKILTFSKYYLNQLTSSFGLTLINPKSIQLTTILDFWKNQLFNRYEDPHFHMIENGIQAFTIKTFKDPIKQNKYSITSTYSRILVLVEMMILYFEGLDEQLHAGSYQYFIAGENYTVSSNTYFYPLAALLIAYFLPRVVHYHKYSRHKPHTETIAFFILVNLIGIAHLVLPSLLQTIFSLFARRPMLFREDLPEPLSLQTGSYSDTYILLIGFFIGLFMIYHFMFEIIYPIIVYAFGYFSTNNTEKQGIISYYKQFKQNKYSHIQKEFLKDALTFQQAMFSAVMALINFPMALGNVLSLQLFLHFASNWKRNSVLKNIILFGAPIAIFSGIGLAFYMKVSYVRLIRYMLIEYVSIGSPVFFHLMFCFCPFAHWYYIKWILLFILLLIYVLLHTYTKT